MTARVPAVRAALLAAAGVAWGCATPPRERPSAPGPETIIASQVVAGTEPVRCAPDDPMQRVPSPSPRAGERVPPATPPHILNACPAPSGARTVVPAPARLTFPPPAAKNDPR